MTVFCRARNVLAVAVLVGMLHTVGASAAAPGCPGDFNGDGYKTIADYTLWRDHFGAPTDAPILESGDGIGGVSDGDYVVWKSNFGQSVGAVTSSPSVGVPEPEAWLLLVLGVVAGVWLRRTTRRKLPVCA